MTIRNRLIISHLTVFIIPILITVVIFFISVAGLWHFIRSGNHLYPETSIQFQSATGIINYTLFRSLRKFGENDLKYAQIVDCLNPQVNYVCLRNSERPIFEYGDKNIMETLDREAGIQKDNLPENAVYSHTYDDAYYYYATKTVGGKNYDLYIVSQKVMRGSDDGLENMAQGTLNMCLFFLVTFVLAASWFLTHFILGRILNSIRSLKNGAEEVQKGTLNFQVQSDAQDEFAPVIKAFNKMTAELANSLEDREIQEEKRKELITSISHDIRTPLTAIKAYVEALRDNVAISPQKREQYLQVIGKKTEELDSIVEQLFLLSRLDVGDEAIPLSKIDLAQFLGEYAKGNSLLWEKQNAFIHISSSGQAWINANEMLLERILHNLISNSVKYKVGKEVKINLSVRTEKTNVIFTVSDDGMGVLDELLPRLAEPFYRTDKARSKTSNGCGLGLTILKKAVILLNGQVAFDNVKPHGFAVIMTLPLMEVDNAEINPDN